MEEVVHSTNRPEVYPRMTHLPPKPAVGGLLYRIPGADRYKHRVLNAQDINIVAYYGTSFNTLVPTYSAIVSHFKGT